MLAFPPPVVPHIASVRAIVRRVALALAFTLLPIAATLAEGFTTRDLTTLELDGSIVGGKNRYVLYRVAPERATFACTDCPELRVIDVTILDGYPDIEARIRAGESVFEEIRTSCEAERSGCRIETIDVAPAEGRLWSWGGGTPGAIAMIALDDDLLSVTSFAGDPAAAAANAEAAVRNLVPRLVGR